MKPNLRVQALCFAFILNVPQLATANDSEANSHCRNCMAQAERIRELEAKLGISANSPAIPAQVPTSTSTYQVAPGDTLERIARKQNCVLSELLASNQLKPDSVIHPGQIIKIPKPANTVEEQSTVISQPSDRSSTPVPVEYATHKVVAGDTFAAIARQHQVPLSALLSANPDTPPTAMRLGQNIRIPQTEATKPMASTDITTIKPGDIPEPAIETPRKIKPVLIDTEMTYQEFASRQGTTTERLNQLNGLDLIDAALLAKGSELLAPTDFP